MRLFEIGEGGHTPKHKHPWSYINYVIDGQGVLSLDGEEFHLQAGSFAYVPGGMEHQFSNRGRHPFALLCIVPEEGRSKGG